MFELYLRDSTTYQRVGRLDVFSKLTIVSRFNRTGSWNLELPKEAKIARVINPNVGIIVYRDGVPYFSGPCNVDYTETSKEISMAGTDDNWLLETPARPTPSLANGPYPNEYDVTTGIASMVMHSLVHRNIGQAAPTPWRIGNLVMAPDTGIGSIVTARARFDPLIVLLAELASTPIATGLGFGIRTSSTIAGQIEFYVYVPRDKHIDTVFSTQLHTAQDYEWQHQVPGANYFIVGGGDDFGINRTVIEGGDAVNIASVGRRVAQFVDKRGVVDTSELYQELAELIAGAVTIDTITVTPADVASIVFGEDYDLGDYVTAVVNGISYPRLIREIEVDFEPERGPIIKPVIADPYGTNDEILSRHLNTLTNRISNLERNWNVPPDSIDSSMLIPVLKPIIGEVTWLARPGIPAGWLQCYGQEVSRSTYSQLYGAIGNIYGDGNGTTTFNVPDLVNRSPIGTGNLYGLGQHVGANESNVGLHSHTGAPHTHPGGHSHGTVAHNHSGAAHTHSGTHSHGMVAHRHQMGHDHTYVHNHGGQTAGPSSDTSRGTTAPVLDVATDFHWHDIASHPSSSTTSNSNNTVTGSGEQTLLGGVFNRTVNDSDTSLFGATYTGDTGNATPDTETDTNAHNADFTDSTGDGGNVLVSIVHPSTALTPIIYAGV